MPFIVFMSLHHPASTYIFDYLELSIPISIPKASKLPISPNMLPTFNENKGTWIPHQWPCQEAFAPRRQAVSREEGTTPHGGCSPRGRPVRGSSYQTAGVFFPQCHRISKHQCGHPIYSKTSAQTSELQVIDSQRRASTWLKMLKQCLSV